MNGCKNLSTLVQRNVCVCVSLIILVGRKEGNVLFKIAFNILFMVIWHQAYRKDHSAKEETSCCHFMSYIFTLTATYLLCAPSRYHHIGYSFQLAARVHLYAPSPRQDSTYHSPSYTSRRALVGMRTTKQMQA